MEPYLHASGTSISMSRHDSPRQPTGGAGAPVGSGFASVAVRPPSPPLPDDDRDRDGDRDHRHGGDRCHRAPTAAARPTVGALGQPVGAGRVA